MAALMGMAFVGAADITTVHDYSVNSVKTDTDTNYSNGGAQGSNALAAGVSAKSTGENAVAIGYGAKADGYGATVIGQYGTAMGRYALVFGGQQTDTTAEQANNVASGDNAVSFGERTTASGANATSFGWQTTAKEKRATAFGERTTASGANSTAFGQLATASGQNSTAFGNEARANNYGSTAFGNRTEALGEYSTAFGNSTVAAGMNTVAFGTDNVAGAVLDDNGAYTNIIYKTNAKGRVVKGENGNPIELSREKMDARGNLAYTDGSSHTKSVTYTVPGGETHNYVLLQGDDGNTYIRDYRGDIRSATIGTDGKVTVGDTALTNVTLKKANAGANGYHILSNANATVWGENSIASGEASTAFGVSSIAAAKNSLAALGGTVAASATNAAAIGSGAKATLSDSVALGSHSVTTRAKYKDLTSDAEKAAYAKGASTGSAWEATDNAIAVGNDSTVTRQITGVAAGSLDTDAVNVAQLKAVDARHTTASVGGKNATADNTVVNGGNLEMTRTTSNGQANYDVSLNKDIVLGQQEENKGGSITVNSVGTFRNYDNQGNYTDYPMKEAVKIDGTTISVVKHDGSDGDNDQRQVVMGVGQDTGGYVALYDNTGKKPTYIFNAISPGITYLNDANEFGRLEYGDIYNGSTQFIATLDDGLKFSGDQGSLSTVKLNQELSVTGGADTNNLSDNNIGVVSNGTNTLTVKLAKNLKDLQSVQTGKTTMDDKGLTIRKSDDDSSKNVIVLGDQVAFGDNQVNNMGSGASKITEDDKGNKTYEYNTLNNGANIGDVKNIASSTVQPVIDTVNKGWELDVNSTKQKAVTPDSPKVNLIQGQNITIAGDTANTDNVTIATADDVRFNTVRVGGAKTGTTYSGGIVIGKQSGGDSANPDENDYITGLKNTNWDSNKIQSGRAATEDQLKKVADDIKQGTVADDVYVTGGEVAYHTDGGSDNGQPTVNDGTGKLTLTENHKTSNIEITGLHDYYVTNGTVTDDGKTLELTRNDRDEKSNPQKISIDLGNVLKHDLHLVQNPVAGSDGKYTVDTKNGTVTLRVQNGDGTDASDITIGGFEGLGKGLQFGANKMAKDGGGNPVTNQLGSTINVIGAGTKNLQDYSGKNLLTSVEQDADGNTTIHVLMDRNISADGVTVGQAGKDGVAGADGEVGQAGTIGINGKNGVKGENGKEGITTTIIRTEKGQPGENGATGKPGVDGKDITRIVYQNDQDKVDGKDGSHTVATLDDGLKFSGDDNKVITKKLNEQLQFVGGADKSKLTENNIGINELEDGKLTIQLVNTPNLGENGNLTAGKAQIGWFAGDTLDMTRDGTNPSGNKAGAGSYATGLSNTDWNVTNPEYVSGRAATEDQLAKVSKAIGNATTAAGKRTVVTVNDKSNPAEATPSATVGAYGDYDSTGGNLMIAAKKDSDGVLTYNIKLNDQLAIGQKGEPGVAGKDGKVTVETKGGTTVVIGHDGEPGKDGKDGLFVTSKDGADGVSITGPNGADGTDGKVGISGTDGKDAVSISGHNGEGHIGLTGPKGADGTPGKDGISIDITTDLKAPTLDSTKNVSTTVKDSSGKETIIEQAPRIQYKSGDNTYEVATMDDGLKFVGNDDQEVTRKLNETLSIKGGLDKDAVAKASTKNLGVRQNATKDGLEIVMTDTPDFTKVTVGGDTKITIGGQTNSDTKNPANGNYITGLDNTKWDKDHVTENRSATEGQLRDIAGSITNQTQGGGFALTSD